MYILYKLVIEYIYVLFNWILLELCIFVYECYLKMVVKYVNVNKIYNYLIWYEYVYNVCMVIVNFVCVN